MKKFLPKTVNNPQGFTLVELLVVIAIIAILATVGLAIFQGQTRAARDARRRGDVDAIAKSMETQRQAGSATYPVLATTYFAGGNIPVDPTNTTSGAGTTCPTACQYCFTVGATPITNCPGTGGNYINSATTAPAAWTASATWTVCANLETTGADSYCRSNQQ